MAGKKPPSGNNPSEWHDVPGRMSPERDRAWAVPKESPVAPAKHSPPRPHKQPVPGTKNG